MYYIYPQIIEKFVLWFIILIEEWSSWNRLEVVYVSKALVDGGDTLYI